MRRPPWRSGGLCLLHGWSGGSAARPLNSLGQAVIAPEQLSIAGGETGRAEDAACRRFVGSVSQLILDGLVGSGAGERGWRVGDKLCQDLGEDAWI